MKLNRLITVALVLFFAFLMVGESEAQCSMCKAVVESSEEGKSINTGILYIMGIPYVLLFIFFRKRIFGLFRALKAAR